MKRSRAKGTTLDWEREPATDLVESRIALLARWVKSLGHRFKDREMTAERAR